MFNQKQEMAKKVSELEEEVELLRLVADENSMLKGSIKKLSEELKEAEAKYAALEAKYRMEVAAKNQMIKNIESETKANDESKQQLIEQLESELEEAIAQLEVKQNEVNDLNDLIELKEQDLSGIQQEVDMYVKEL